jgi:hypothetical protein
MLSRCSLVDILGEVTARPVDCQGELRDDRRYPPESADSTPEQYGVSIRGLSHSLGEPGGSSKTVEEKHSFVIPIPLVLA